ncbi:hypothetical protein AGMMS50276_25410 [Synergistales bacterium]|nr:hypothetical protein AGMMS50276_25410 [Synergistales bacterium]
MSKCDELNPIVSKALLIAVKVHGNKADRYGRPFIAHVITVGRFLEGEIAQAAGILHDVMEEDPSWDLNRFREKGFPDKLLKILDDLTKRDNEFYTHYIKRIGEDAISCYVKAHDILDNLDPRRMIQQHARKYRAALQVVLKCLRKTDMALYVKTSESIRLLLTDCDGRF